MITVLSLIGVTILIVLLLVSFKRQSETRGERKHAEAHRHSPELRAQQEQTRQRRASVRAAYQERDRAGASATPARSDGSDADE
jgi:hypothetical protein